jgi:hypothetical protein
MANLHDLAERLERIAVQTRQVGNEVKKAAVIAIVTDLAYNTPIDEGVHLSNWQVGIGRPPQGPRGAHFPGEGGSTRTPNAQLTVGLARLAVERVKPGVPVFISNEAPAIVRLNEGWSAQAPAGFVDRALLVARGIARKVRTFK